MADNKSILIEFYKNRLVYLKQAVKLEYVSNIYDTQEIPFAMFNIYFTVN